MALGKLGQTLTAREIQNLVKKDLDRVEREIGLESIASVDAVTTISRYLQDGGGKRLRPILVLLASRVAGSATDGSVPDGRRGRDDSCGHAGARRRHR